MIQLKFFNIYNKTVLYSVVSNNMEDCFHSLSHQFELNVFSAIILCLVCQKGHFVIGIILRGHNWMHLAHRPLP